MYESSPPVAWEPDTAPVKVRWKVFPSFSTNPTQPKNYSRRSPKFCAVRLGPWTGSVPPAVAGGIDLFQLNYGLLRQGTQLENRFRGVSPFVPRICEVRICCVIVAFECHEFPDRRQLTLRKVLS